MGIERVWLHEILISANPPTAMYIYLVELARVPRSEAISRVCCIQISPLHDGTASRKETENDSRSCCVHFPGVTSGATYQEH